MKKFALAFLFPLAITFLSSTSHADSFGDKCLDIAACTKYVSELLGQKYVYDNDVKGKVNVTANTEITRENAELLFTHLLHANGYARVPLGQVNSYQILRERDARDLNLAVIKGGPLMREADIPGNWDLYTLIYKCPHPETVEELARTLRSFMPANSRIIPNELSGNLFITDSAMNLRKLVELLKEMDFKPTAELKKRWAERARQAEVNRTHPGTSPGKPSGT